MSSAAVRYGRAFALLAEALGDENSMVSVDSFFACSLPGRLSVMSRGATGTSGEDAVRVRPGIVVLRGSGTPPGESGDGSRSSALSCRKPGKFEAVGEGTADDILAWRDCLPDIPVSGLTMSLTTDSLRCLSELKVADCSVGEKGLWPEIEPLGDGSEKLEGVRGREMGDWSRIWSIMCSLTAR